MMCGARSLVGVFGAVLLGVFVSGAGAQDDRWIDTPTGWTYLLGATSSDVNNLISGGQRVFNIERTGNNQYDAIGVTNSGDYAHTGSQVLYGQSFSSLSSYLSASGHRLLDLEAYESGGTENFAAVTVRNGGSTGVSGWGWLYRASPTAINNWISGANPPLRLIDLDVYTLGGTDYYTAVAVENTGAQQQGWWYYYNQTAAQVTTLLTQNGARLVDIEVDREPTLQNPNTLFTVIMVDDNPGSGWWYPSLTTDQINEVLGQTGGRLTCLTRYTNAFGQVRYAAALVDNANAETRRIRDLTRATIPTGDYGFKIKEVGGGTLVALNEHFVFEPASQMKILHAAYAMRRVSLGLDSLDNTVVVNTGTDSGQSCPYSVSPTSPTLRTTMQQMLRPSSNHHTEALRQRYGTTNLNNYATAIGLSDVRLNHTLGCLCSSLNFNTFTSRDAVSMYEQIADGTLFGMDLKDELFSIMSNYDELGNPRVDAVMNQEFDLTGLTPTERAAFRAAFNQANKGGSYTCGSGGSSPRRWRTDAGWATIPFKTAAPFYLQFDREYAMSIFLNDSADPSSATDEIYNIFYELIRLPLRAAMQSWDAACDPDGILFHPQDDTVVEGDDAGFSVTVLARPGSRDYRWQKLISGSWTSLFNGVGYAGTDTADLTVFNAQPDDAGQYRVRITKECGQTVSQPATLEVTVGCTADFDNNGVLNFFDVAAFIDAYNTQSPAADLAAPFGVLNFFDVAAFISAYNAGCP